MTLAVAVNAGSARRPSTSRGFLSRDQTSPAELPACSAGDVRRYNGELIIATVRQIVGDADLGFVVELDNRRRSTARERPGWRPRYTGLQAWRTTLGA